MSAHLNIREITPDKPIILSKIDFTCDDLDDSIPEPLPQKNFFMIISGRAGSGKTSLILNLLTKRGKCFNRKFDKVFLFGSSFKTIKNKPFKDLPDEQKYNGLSEDTLEEALSSIADSGEKILFVMDDVVNDISRSGSLEKKMCSLIMNRRHLCGEGGSLSIMLSSQVYNKIPAPIRKNADKVIIYHTRNKKEIESLLDELICIPKDEFYQILNYCFDKVHNFMYIDINKPPAHMFFKNFNQLEFNSHSLRPFEA
tara:strand:- start:165 stop:929 length:765 start_codon:yes stop_codon:yes gene_type:complete